MLRSSIQAIVLGVSLVLAGPAAGSCPTADHSSILMNPAVQDALDQAWVDSQEGTPNEHEEGGYVFECGYTTDQGVVWVYDVKRWAPGNEESVGSLPPIPPGPNCRAIVEFHTHPGAASDDPKANDDFVNEKPSDQDVQIAKEHNIPGIMRYGLGSDPAKTNDVVYGPQTPWQSCPPPSPAPAPPGSGGTGGNGGTGGGTNGNGTGTDGGGTGGGNGGTTPGGPTDTTGQDFPEEPGDNTGGGESVGDPHLVTFDGWPYEFQATGEYVLAASTEDDFEIQVRHEEIPGRQLSVTTAVAASVDGVPVEFRLGDVIIDGESTRIEPGLDLAAGDGRITSEDGSYIFVTWPDGSELGIIGRALLVRPAADRQGTLTGLLGDWDGDVTNDLVVGDDQLLDDYQLTFDETYGDFAEQWKVGADDSLFTYDDGQSGEDFVVEDFPRFPASSHGLDPDQLAAALDQCREAGVTDPRRLDDCALDVAASGDVTYADEAASVDNAERTGASADEFGQTELIAAVSDRDPDRVRALLEAGADTEGRDDLDRTALDVAVTIGDPELIQILLDAGADPDAVGNYGNRPLHDAATFGKAEAVTLLLEAGADPDAENDFGETPLDLARQHGRDDVVELLS